MFAFYLAYKRGAEGYLIEKFKKKYLKEAEKRKDELYAKFFKLYKSETMSDSVKDKVLKIYEEEIKR